MIVLNWSAIVGDIVAKSTIVMRTPTIVRPTPGTPWRLTRPNTDGNMPSAAAAFADCPTSSIQPPSEPTDLRIAQTATTAMPHVPITSRAASANGACDVWSCAFGMMPMITVELRMYTTAASPRPISVASGMLRFGFSMTPADTAALSMPMYAQSAIDAAREIARVSESPLTFQPEKKT